MPLYEFRGKRPRCHDTAWVAPSADLIGDVVLADEANVWFGAVIRADNTEIAIGARSNIQDGAMLHSDPGAPCTVGEDCTVGHHAILHGCTVANRALIGMGAIVLNHAVIPEDCIVGAGALVTEGKTFEPGSLIVGSPAKAVRKLDEKTIAFLKLSAQSYVGKSREAMTEMTRID